MKKLLFLLLLPVCLRAQLPFAETLPSGTSGQTLRHDGTSFVASSVVTNNGTNVGIGASPDGTYKLYASGAAKFGGRIYATGTGAYSVSTSPNLLLENTTSSTGRPFYLLSSDLGKLEWYSTPNSTPIMSLTNIGDVTVNKRITVGEKWGASSTGNELIGRNFSGGLCKITLGSGLTLTDSTLSASGGGGSSYYQTFRDDGTGVTQRGKVNFVSSSQINLALTDDSGNDETEVIATLAQNSATTGQVMKWDGSAWSPGTDNNDGGFNVISPSQLTARTDNWNPTGLSTASQIRLSGDNSFRQITGIAAPSSGKTLLLTNVGDYCVLLTRENTNSSAANRLSMENDIPLLPGETITLAYDATSSRWRIAGMPAMQNSNNWFSIQQGRFSSTTAADYDYLNFAANSGSISGANASAGSLCRLSCSTSSSATAYPTVTLKGVSAYADNTAGTNTSMSFTTKVHFSQASDGSNTYVARMGILASSSNGDDAGCYFRYTHTENSGNWVCVTRTAGGTETLTNTSVAPLFSLSTGQKMQVYIRPDGTSAFFIDGVNVAEHASTNFPDNSNMTIRAQCQKTVGTTNIFMHISWIGFDNCYR